MYTRRMPNVRTAVLILACLMLLAARVGGVHTHLDADGYAGTPTGSHVHSVAHRHTDAPAHDHHDHDHELAAALHGVSEGELGHADRHGDLDHDGDRDVVLDLLAASKLALVVAALCFGLYVAFVRDGKIRAPTRLRPPPAESRHWRPPLRAPPALP